MSYQRMQAAAAPRLVAKSPIVKVQAYSRPYQAGPDWLDRAQSYYLEGLRQAAEMSHARFERIAPSRFPRALEYLGWVRRSWRLRHIMNAGHQWAGRTLDRLGTALAAPQALPSGLGSSSVGHYLFHLADGTIRKVCLDAQDSGELASPELAAWSDLYFKTNYWPGHLYPDNVRPCFNCNPMVLGRLRKLRALRSVAPVYDLCFVVRVWGGTDEVSGVEHILRLLEAVAQVDCKKYLLAYLVTGDVDGDARRLARSGVRAATVPMPIRKLWKLTAQSRVNVVRLGMHACIPWRMTDLLAMGACPVLDQAPFTAWPVPLQEGTHYLQLGTTAELRHPVAADAQYDRIPAVLSGILAQRQRIDDIRHANAEYFDHQVSPLAVGEYICRTVMELTPAPRPSIFNAPSP